VATKIDLNEELIYFSEAKRKLPDAPSWRQLNFWRSTGIKIGSKRVKIEAVRLSRGWATTLSAYHRFVDRMNQGAG
jgi:hypothetical protein